MSKGILYASGTYFFFGILPLYWKMLGSVPAGEILAHRISWSFLCLALYFAVKRNFGWLKVFAGNGRLLLFAFATTLLVTANWGIYIWAVNAGRVIESSLGYFMNPLVSVLIGVVVLGERLRAWQWLSVAIAFAGVLYLSVNLGTVPWVALGLAGSFSLYGMLKKKSSLTTMQGMFAETAGAFLPAAGYIVWQEFQGQGALGNGDPKIVSLLAVSGILTAIPLILFAKAAKLIPLSLLGILQYMTPTLQFLLGVFVFKEAMSSDRLIGFAFIWFALLIYTSEGLLKRRSATRALAARAGTA
ncbi:EamA family transporter RarD [Pelagicoccus albus]|uniref:EamA family transporter RarD n=1 Tax=Pelagicoccus albus TaxID=415222 RepID=A0A7X1B5W9_9BACT|nr:EamA family transporter RarD [Pelagicoccus albus]MBC2605128.1 EamA family transporter RarD [Pelagicoccus albus]